MKKFSKLFAMLCVFSLLLSSCHSYTTVVGEGAQGNTEEKSWNHYVIAGLVPVGVSDAKEMAGGAENYTVTTKQSFVNGLVAALTFSIYSPTTTIVKK
ncbi:Bor family protein [Mesonia aquimarina]|uniref:Bor family protein n=1 Tax=Mesonia aquimarina TaxID=1504967 RepID=UPI000EF575CC|nr:Bor family protein [Mesonia aquimarina]